jgi:adenylate cyclase
MLAAHSFSKHRASLNPEELYQARTLLQQSLSVDPNYARAHAALVAMHLMSWYNAFDEDFLASETLERAYACARKAIQLDPNLPEAHAEAGHVLAWRREHDASIAAFETASALNPNYFNWNFTTALVFAGEFGKAIDVAKAYMRFDPFYPSFVFGWLGLAHYMRKEYTAALPLLREQAVRIPNLRGGRIWLAATYAKMGLLDEARAEAKQVLRILPSYTIDGVGRHFICFKNPQDTEHFFDGVRLAGLPEH